MLGLIREPKTIVEALGVYMDMLKAAGDSLLNDADMYPERHDAHIELVEDAYTVACAMQEAVKGVGWLVDTRLGTAELKAEFERREADAARYMEGMQERRCLADKFARKPYDEQRKIVDARRRRRERIEEMRRTDGMDKR